MSTLSSALSDLASLFYGSRCAACGKNMDDAESFICLECRLKMPTTSFHKDYDNAMACRVRSLSPRVEGVAAYFYYVNKGRWRDVIHSIKYYDMWYTARRLGRWYGSELATSPYFQDVDVIVPIPLHAARRLHRRYNQSEKIAEGIAQELGAKVLTRAVVRSRNNPSQVTRSSLERWTNVSDIFRVRRPEQLSGKHILIVDDVFTTGATITSCIDAIEQSVADCRISVATLAVSRRHIGGIL